MESGSDFLVISSQECNNTFKELNLGRPGRGIKSDNDQIAHIYEITEILSHHGVTVHSQPKDKNKLNQWQSEVRKLQLAFTKMKQQAKNKKYFGSFYDSRKIEFFATYKTTNHQQEVRLSF